jgi:DNA-binding response OmpR family regulator
MFYEAKYRKWGIIREVKVAPDGNPSSPEHEAISAMRLLLVEDYAPLRESLAEGLAEAVLPLTRRRKVEEGLWYARSNDYDVIILDLMLPKVDGLTILKTLRQLGNPVHVLILTARDTLPDRVRGLDFGADDYLVKPFAFEELLARVRALIRRRYGAKTR